MKTVSAAEMRELDRRTIEEFGIPGEELMRRAGWGLAEMIRGVLSGADGGAILMLAGMGNNGGDVFAAAAELAQSEFDIEVWICGTQTKIEGDARAHLNRMIRSGILPREVRHEQDFSPVHWPDLVVDGLLGTGSRGAPRGVMAPLIDWMNELGETAFVLSVDIPSGLDADTGRGEGPVVRADLTATMGLAKTGLIRPEALPFVGALEILDIGIPLELIEDVTGCQEAELIDRSDIWLPRRHRTAHKGSFGQVLLLGGSTGYSGAIAMAARAAVRSGAGLVRVATPEEVYPLVAQAAGPEVMVHPYREGDPESLPGDGVEFSAILAGPGMGRSLATRRMVEFLLETCEPPLVLDADALCVSPAQIAGARGPVLLTPHPGEFRRLFGMVVADRLADARAAAERVRGVVVLKGAGTVVAAPGCPVAVNLTGNPGMATGGTGDVLAGLLTGFLGQGMPPAAAAAAAVYLHGLAGDFAAADRTQRAMTAVDLIEALPDAFFALGLR